MLRVDSHAWAASSADTHWKTAKKAHEGVEIVNHSREPNMLLNGPAFVTAVPSYPGYPSYALVQE